MTCEICDRSNSAHASTAVGAALGAAVLARIAQQKTAPRKNNPRALDREITPRLIESPRYVAHQHDGGWWLADECISYDAQIAGKNLVSTF